MSQLMSSISPNHSELEDLSRWVGNTIVEHDHLDEFPLKGLSALLDYGTLPWSPKELPVLAHWLYFRPTSRESELGMDGHPKRGKFLPPVPLDRRMWAGGDLKFLAPLPVGAEVEKKSTISDIQIKKGSTGSLVFVKLRHEIKHNGHVCVDENQDIVYRGLSTVVEKKKATESKKETPWADIREEKVPTPTMLFRFSALTFNGHRIHYDQDYAIKEEGYEERIVHGPLLSTMLADLFYRMAPGQHVSRFSFRALKPLFVNQSLQLCLRWTAKGAELWAENCRGDIAMNATIESYENG